MKRGDKVTVYTCYKFCLDGKPGCTERPGVVFSGSGAWFKVKLENGDIVTFSRKTCNNKLGNMYVKLQNGSEE